VSGEVVVHRFRPRYRGIAWGSIGSGGTLGAVSLALGLSTVPLVAGVLGVAFGMLYLGSPTWKLEVVTDAEQLTVRTPTTTKFSLAWRDVVRVVASPTTHTAFVDGGTPETSLLVPGDGAPAPYAIQDSATLVATILARVAAEKVETVESLDRRSPK
jgi:hypothetical protein